MHQGFLGMGVEVCMCGGGVVPDLPAIIAFCREIAISQDSSGRTLSPHVLSLTTHVL